MIQQFVDAWFRAEAETRATFASKRPGDYADIVRMVVEAISVDDDSSWEPSPDPERIHEIDDGHYQGTTVYVIGARGYQPDTYWYVRIAYGSCSGCDTLEAIRGWEDEITATEVDGYMTLALHVVQGLRQMGGEVV